MTTFGDRLIESATEAVTMVKLMRENRELRRELDAEKALADQLHEVAYACVSYENPARTAYRKARGL